MDDDVAATHAGRQADLAVGGFETLDRQVVVALGAGAPFLEADLEKAPGCLVGTHHVTDGMDASTDRT